MSTVRSTQDTLAALVDVTAEQGEDAKMFRKSLMQQVAQANEHLEAVRRSADAIYRLLVAAVVLPPLLAVLYAVWAARG